MYKLIMVIANIKHKTWWWNGKSVYSFDDLESLFRFMTSRIPGTAENIVTICARDNAITDGRLYCTSWYDVEKGDKQMTEYTSL